MSASYMTRLAVSNEGCDPLLDLKVFHIFGDSEPEIMQWDAPLEGGRRSETRNVTFATGFGNMLDHDWWRVSWRTEKNNQEYLHSLVPSNTSMFANYLIMQAGGMLSSAGRGPGVASAKSTVANAGVLGAELANLLLGSIVRKVDKKNLKEHMLQDADAFRVGVQLPDAFSGIGLIISIDAAGGMVFRSPSGKSTANYQTVAVPGVIPEV